MPAARSSAFPEGLPPAVERVASFLVGTGHAAAPSVAMAANLLNESLAHRHRRYVRQHRSLTMTPQECQRLADALQSRRALIEGTLLSLEGPDVREGAVLSAHALCEAREARRRVQLRLGGAAAQQSQVDGARERLRAELDSIDRLAEAATEKADKDGEVLSQGVDGGKAHPRVVHLQNRLNMLGHRVAADGRFGPVTAEAVKDFQAKAGMEPTGEVDGPTREALRHGRQVVEVGPAAVLAPETLKKLADIGVGDPNKETASVDPATPAAEKAAAASKPASSAGLTLGMGVGERSSRDVKALQLKLGAAGHPVAQDGRFGPKTAAAVKKFQRKNGLEPSGACDDRTMRALRDAAKSNLREGAVSKACPTCGAPMRKDGNTCQRGHRIEFHSGLTEPPTEFKRSAPVEEASSAVVHFASGASAEGGAEKDEVKAGRAAHGSVAEAMHLEVHRKDGPVHRRRMRSRSDALRVKRELEARGHKVYLREGRLEESWESFDELRKGDKVYATRHHTTTGEPGRVLKGRSLTVESSGTGVLAARDDVSGDLHTYNRPAANDALAKSKGEADAKGERDLDMRDEMRESWEKFDELRKGGGYVPFNKGDKVEGEYFGHKITGTVNEHRHDTMNHERRHVHVQLDKPITHNGSERQRLHFDIDSSGLSSGSHLSAPGASGFLRPRSAQKLQESVELEESPQTAALSVTHAPIGKGGTNWITRSKPGNTGQLPAYIQNVRNAIMRGGKSVSDATRIAIGRIRDWAEGKGGVSAEVKAAAAKAIGEFDAMRGAAHAKSAVKKVQESIELTEADTPADFPNYLACPTCHVKTLPGYETCPRGHRIAGAKKLREALIRSVIFNRDVELLLRECEELRESWEEFDAQRHKASWSKLVKAGPMPGQPHKDSPGRGPTGKMRNFESMAPHKLAATLEALAVHGEDPEAHHAAMHAAGVKLGMKLNIAHPEPKPKVHSLLGEGATMICECGAPVRDNVCQRGHRLEETWSDAARQAALVARRERGRGVPRVDVTRGKYGPGGTPVSRQDRDPKAVEGDIRKQVAQRQSGSGVGNAGGHKIMLAAAMKPSTERMTLHAGFGKGSSEGMHGIAGVGPDGVSREPLSMSRHEKVAAMFGHQAAQLHLTVPKGHPMFDVPGEGGHFKQEGEVVLPAGTKITPQRVETINGVKHIHATASMAEPRRLAEAIGNIDKGAFHRWLGKPDDEPITAEDIARGKAAGGHPAKMAQFAENFKDRGKGK